MLVGVGQQPWLLRPDGLARVPKADVDMNVVLFGREVLARQQHVVPAVGRNHEHPGDRVLMLALLQGARFQVRLLVAQERDHAARHVFQRLLRAFGRQTRAQHAVQIVLRVGQAMQRARVLPG